MRFATQSLEWFMRKSYFVVFAAVLAACGPRVSGEIGQACLAGGRSAANPQLCSCIQQVANQSLSGRDQRRAATFFADPQLAQDIRQADGRANEAFWQRYRAFYQQAQQSCG